MRLSLSCASSIAVSYLADFASIAALIQAAPLLKSPTKNSSTHAANEAAIFLVVIFCLLLHPLRNHPQKKNFRANLICQPLKQRQPTLLERNSTLQFISNSLPHMVRSFPHFRVRIFLCVYKLTLFNHL